MWPREMIFSTTGMFDKKHNAALSIIRSIDEGQLYFNEPAPKTKEGHIRLDIKRGYHYFQYINDNKTRYVTILNTDPKLEMIPSWLINYMMTKVCYQMLAIVQDKAKKVESTIYAERIRNRPGFYGKMDEYI